MNRKLMTFAILAMTIAVGPGLAQPPTGAGQANGGAVSGHVMSSESVSVAFATVVLVNASSGNLVLPNGTSVSGPAFMEGISDKNGDYQITGVPTGMYTVCVHAENAVTLASQVPNKIVGALALRPEPIHYLDPCSFGGALKISVAQGASQTANLTLQRGIPVTVVVRDPKGILSASGATLPALSLVDQSGAFRAALTPSAQPDSTVRYSALVPIGVAYRLSIQPNGLALTSSDHGALPTTTPSVLASSSGATAALLTGAREVVIGDFSVVPGH